MALIKNIDTNEVFEVNYRPHAEDIMDEVMEACGLFQEFELEDGRFAFLLTQEDADWWERWARAQVLIDEAYENADEWKQAASEHIVCDMSPDMDSIMEAQLELFGIEL